MTTRTGKRRPRSNKSSRQWRKMDLHLHTPGSDDYQEPTVSYLDILRQAHLRGLDMIAFTDHNTVAGYATMHEEIDRLTWLESLGRIEPQEQKQLDEYRRLLDSVLVLPGFEFTAMFGFHILGIFPPDTPVRLLELLLLNLQVPASLLHKGTTTAGATSDVLTAYRLINEAGGLVIAAHANSKNGVGMKHVDFGGQTRIAYTQDPNLHCLEVTDLDKRGRYTTQRFFSGAKPEYPRPMRCIQGSDAHRVAGDPYNPKNLGVGERITEILLDEVSFKSLAKVIKGNDLSLTRPFRGRAQPLDFVKMAREEGVSINQSFHESAAKRGGHFRRIMQDVGAMANTNGGTIYIGVSPNPKEDPVGVRDPKKLVKELQEEFAKRFSPEPDVEVDYLPSQKKDIVRITVEVGTNVPYALDNNLFYVRDEAETNLAVRDEIIGLVERGLQRGQSAVSTTTHLNSVATVVPETRGEMPAKPTPTSTKSNTAAPRTGVEIVDSQVRKGTAYHTVRDLRNGNLIKDVTKSSARKLWHYAISQREAGLPKPKKIKWQGDMAVLDARKKDDYIWYDLALREGNDTRIFFGVTDSGLNDRWQRLIESSNVAVGA